MHVYIPCSLLSKRVDLTRILFLKNEELVRLVVIQLTLRLSNILAILSIRSRSLKYTFRDMSSIACKPVLSEWTIVNTHHEIGARWRFRISYIIADWKSSFSFVHKRNKQGFIESTEVLSRCAFRSFAEPVRIKNC